MLHDVHAIDPVLQLNTGTALALAVQNQPEEVEPQSVIHAPAGFGKFVGYIRSPIKQRSDICQEAKSTLPPPPQQQKEPRTTTPPERVMSDSERPRADSADSYRSDDTVTVNARESNPNQKVLVLVVKRSRRY